MPTVSGTTSLSVRASVRVDTFTVSDTDRVQYNTTAACSATRELCDEPDLFTSESSLLKDVAPPGKWVLVVDASLLLFISCAVRSSNSTTCAAPLHFLVLSVFSFK